MNRFWHHWLKQGADRLGFIVHRKRRDGSARELSEFELALTTALSARGSLSIIQVGANDGKINDPIHRFLLAHRTSTTVLLVEPMLDLGPILRESYASHPDARIAHVAAGPKGSLTLFSIAPQYWNQCQPDYARGWPIYRAPMGVTSTSRQHVEDFLLSNFTGDELFQKVIQEVRVDSLPIVELAQTYGLERVDVLQIDAEGYDDEILLSASLEELEPLLINYEHASLPMDRRERLEAYLHELGYTLNTERHDTLAVLDRSRSESIRKG